MQPLNAVWHRRCRRGQQPGHCLYLSSPPAIALLPLQAAPQEDEQRAEQIRAYPAEPLQRLPPAQPSLPGGWLDALDVPLAAGAEHVGAAPSSDVGAAPDASSSCHSLGRQVAQILAGLQPLSQDATEQPALHSSAGMDASPGSAACEVATLPPGHTAGQKADMAPTALSEPPLSTTAAPALEPAPPSTSAATADGCDAAPSPPFLRASSGGSSSTSQASWHAGGHSPRRSSGSVSWDAEASKRYSGE